MSNIESRQLGTAVFVKCFSYDFLTLQTCFRFWDDCVVLSAWQLESARVEKLCYCTGSHQWKTTEFHLKSNGFMTFVEILFFKSVGFQPKSKSTQTTGVHRKWEISTQVLQNSFHSTITKILPKFKFDFSFEYNLKTVLV